MVTLRGLGRVLSEQGCGSASYNALLAVPQEGVTLEMGRRRITLRLTREGIAVEVGGDSRGSPRQLALPLKDDFELATGE